MSNLLGALLILWSKEGTEFAWSAQLFQQELILPKVLWESSLRIQACISYLYSRVYRADRYLRPRIAPPFVLRSHFIEFFLPLKDCLHRLFLWYDFRHAQLIILALSSCIDKTWYSILVILWVWLSYRVPISCQLLILRMDKWNF